MASFKIVKVDTKPIKGQKPGTSGLRKKVFNINSLNSEIKLF